MGMPLEYQLKYMADRRDYRYSTGWQNHCLDKFGENFMADRLFRGCSLVH